MGFLVDVFSNIRVYKSQTVRHPTLKILILLIMVIPVVIIISVFASNRGYQERCSPILLTTMRRIRGSVDLRNLSKESLPHQLRSDHEKYARIWDNLELTWRGDTDSSTDSVIIATNVAITSQESNKTCSETDFLAPCATDADCTEYEILPKGHGPLTGRCVISDDDPTRRSCEIKGWCPVEKYPGQVPILQDAGNLSLFLQAIVKFDLNGDTFYTRNVRSVQHAKILSDEDLKSCLYQNNDSKFRYCPRFLVRDVVRFSGTDYENDAIIYGGIFTINMEWNCDFAKYSETECIPKYSFKRLDTRTEYETVEPSSVHGITNGFRAVSHDGLVRRTVVMTNGIRIVFTVTGQGFRFNWWVTFVGIGSQLEILSVLYSIVPIAILWIFYKRHSTGLGCNKACACVFADVRFTDEDMHEIKIALQGKDAIPKRSTISPHFQSNNGQVVNENGGCSVSQISEPNVPRTTIPFETFDTIHL